MEKLSIEDIFEFIKYILKITVVVFTHQNTFIAILQHN